MMAPTFFKAWCVVKLPSYQLKFPEVLLTTFKMMPSVVDFPLPGVAERLRIWRGVIPDGVDATALDFDFLASRFALAGGHIRAIVFHACLQCAEAGAPRALTMHAVIRAVQREYDKLERASSLVHFGPYAPLVASERSVR